jgi:MFS family permease
MPSAGESRAADRIGETVQREAKGNKAMKLFYGWVIVGAGMVVTCVGFGAMFSLGVFLQPLSAATGWSGTGIATAALLNFLGMGGGAFAWGALSDRLGTRAVVLLGGVLLGLGAVAIAGTFRPPRQLPAALPSPSVAHLVYKEP